MTPFWSAGHETSVVQLVVQMPNSFAIHQPIGIVHEPSLGRKMESRPLFLIFVSSDNHIPLAVTNIPGAQISIEAVCSWTFGGGRSMRVSAGTKKEQE